MKYIYAVLLLQSGGKEISEENIKKVIQATDSEIDEAQMKSLTTALSGVDIEEILNTVNTTPVAAAAPATDSTTTEDAKTEETKKAPEEDKKTEEEAVEGLGSLFG